MRRFIALVIYLLCVAIAFAGPRHILLSGTHLRTYGPRLAAMLGPDYLIGYPSTKRVHTIVPPTPDVAFLDLTPSHDDWIGWEAGIDDFVPSERSFVQTMKHGGKTRVILVIPDLQLPGTAASLRFSSLCGQIANESNCEIIQLADDRVTASNTLYLSIISVQRNPGTWKLVSATSEQSDEGPAKNAIDNNPDTYWHTRYDPNPTKVPHELVIDLGKDQTLNGFSYLARQDGGVNGRVKDFEVYLSGDPNTWGEPVIKGTFQNTMSEQRLLFVKPARGRYLKFRALSEVNGNIWTSMAELGIMPSGN